VLATATVEETTDGLVVYPKDWDRVRDPRIMHLWTGAPAPAPETLPLTERRPVGDAVARYGVQCLEGESGGPECRVVIEMPVCGIDLHATQVIQQEWGHPPFPHLWALLETARYADAP